MSIEDQLQEYLNLNKTLTEMRKQQKVIKEKADALEKGIKQYMTDNGMDSINLKDGEIVLYSRKVSQTFKKEAIVEKLTEELHDTQKAEQLTQCILQNKKFLLEDKIKAVLKKSK